MGGLKKHQESRRGRFGRWQGWDKRRECTMITAGHTKVQLREDPILEA
jgi:hypothetical protein